MQRYIGYSATTAGVRSALATVTVVLASDGVTQPQLYSTNDLANPTPLNNPFLADASGLFAFYARNGRYTVSVSAGTPVISPAIAFSDILLYDPLDEPPGTLLGQIIDVRAYGARCDNVTDDTAAVRAALAAMTTGGVLLFPANTTTLISDFISPAAANTVIMGGGPGCVIAQTTAADLIRCAFSGCSVNNLTLTRTVIGPLGSAFNLTAGADDFHIVDVVVTAIPTVVSGTSVARLRMQRCRMTAPAAGGTAFLLSGCTGGNCADLTILGFDLPLNLFASSHKFLGRDWYVEASTAHTGTGFVLTNSDDCTLDSITVAGADGFNAGVVGTTCNRLTLTGWRYLTPPTANDVVKLTGCNTATVWDWKVAALPTNIVAMNFLELNPGNTAGCDDAQIGNIRGSGGNSFLGVTNCQRIDVDGCDWSLSASNAIVIVRTSNYYRIHGCSFTTCGSGIAIGDGTNAGDTCLYGLIEQNSISGCSLTFGTAVAVLGCKFGTIRNNMFVNNTWDGINIENDATPNYPNFWQVSDNYCSLNGHDGIYIQQAWEALVDTNVCIGNGRNGIVLVQSSDCTIAGNTATDNGQTVANSSGIGITQSGGNGCIRPVVVGNTASARLSAQGLANSANQVYGIYIDSTTAGGIVDGNLCHGNITANIQFGAGETTLHGTNYIT